ncbi:MAG: PorT family protein [Prevotellaceae bacterium]|jgi:hypothetical protein|nr:PorT family protein [Prevotellaceae bacterium]
MKKILLIISILTIFDFSIKSQNLATADYKPIHFGFMLGINAMDFGIKPTLQTIDGVVYQADVSTLVPGFTVGVIGDVRLGEYFNFRLTPALHLGERTLSFVNDKNSEVIKQNIKSNLLTVPVYFKYSAVRIKNYRPYLIAGGGVSFDLGRDREKPVLLKTMDYFIDFGVGCTFYFPYFRFSPEIKFALGFNNLLTPLNARPRDFITDEDKRFTNSMSRLTSRLFTFVFNFE